MTVTAPDEVFKTFHDCPATTLVVGNVTVCVVDPVKIWTCADALVSAVVPAAVVTDADDGMNPAAVSCPDELRCAIAEALAA